jgi:hypothetical protein
VTLVELLVVCAVALIISAVAFTIYRINTSYYLREEAYIQQQQNLRAAMYLVGRDLRMAGNGLMVLGPAVEKVQAWTPTRLDSAGVGGVVIDTTPGWFSHAGGGSDPGARAVFGVDGDDSRPDVVTIFRAEVEYPTSLGLVSSLSGRRLTLSSDIMGGTLAAGDIIGLVNGADAVLLEVDSFSGDTIDYVSNGRFTGPSGPPSGFPVEGASVFNLRDVSLVTYYVDEASNRLMAAHHDQAWSGFDDLASRSTVVANNIEDLQIHYYFGGDEVDPDALDDGPDMSLAILDDNSVKAVAMAMTSRSSYGEGAMDRVRPGLYNRLDGTAADNRRRATLSEYIYLRNHSR